MPGAPASVTVAPTAPDTPAVSADTPIRSPGLRSLAAKRQELRDKLYLDLQVPRWGPDIEIWVRYNPVDVTRTEEAIEKRRRSRKEVPDWLLYANADVLSMACQGVYAIENGDYDTKKSLNVNDETGPWTKFDPDLADALGIPHLGAAHTVRALYLTDGDLLSAATKLTEWSGLPTLKADEDF